MPSNFSKYLSAWLMFQSLKPDWKILDVGCGRLSPLKFTKKGSYRVGIDHYEPYIKASKKLAIHDKYILADAKNLPFKDNSFQVVIAIEIIEHLKKQDSFKIIKEMERVASKKMILTTPNGFLKTLPGDLDNPNEFHLSGWDVGDLKELGFKVRGLGGFKNLWKVNKKGEAVLRGFYPISFFLAALSQFLVYFYPKKAFRLLAIKSV